MVKRGQMRCPGPCQRMLGSHHLPQQHPERSQLPRAEGRIRRGSGQNPPSTTRPYRYTERAQTSCCMEIITMRKPKSFLPLSPLKHLDTRDLFRLMNDPTLPAERRRSYSVSRVSCFLLQGAHTSCKAPAVGRSPSRLLSKKAQAETAEQHGSRLAFTFSWLCVVSRCLCSPLGRLSRAPESSAGFINKALSLQVTGNLALPRALWESQRLPF